MATRAYWMKASSGDYRGFKLTDEVCWINYNRLTRMERENPISAVAAQSYGGAAASYADASGAGAHVGKGNGGAARAVRPQGQLHGACFNCGEFGHSAKFCHNRAQTATYFKPQGANYVAPYTVQPPTQLAIRGPQPDAGKGNKFANNIANVFGKGGKAPKGGKAKNGKGF